MIVALADRPLLYFITPFTLCAIFLVFVVWVIQIRWHIFVLPSCIVPCLFPYIVKVNNLLTSLRFDFLLYFFKDFSMHCHGCFKGCNFQRRPPLQYAASPWFGLNVLQGRYALQRPALVGKVVSIRSKRILLVEYNVAGEFYVVVSRLEDYLFVAAVAAHIVVVWNRQATEKSIKNVRIFSD